MKMEDPTWAPHLMLPKKYFVLKKKDIKKIKKDKRNTGKSPRNKSTCDFIKLGMLSSTDGSNIKQLKHLNSSLYVFLKCNIAFI